MIKQHLPAIPPREEGETRDGSVAQEAGAVAIVLAAPEVAVITLG